MGTLVVNPTYTYTKLTGYTADASTILFNGTSVAASGNYPGEVYGVYTIDSGGTEYHQWRVTSNTTTSATQYTRSVFRNVTTGSTLYDTGFLEVLSPSGTFNYYSDQNGQMQSGNVYSVTISHYSAASNEMQRAVATWTMPTIQYTISFNSNGGSSVSPITVNQGSSLTLPNPTRSGYTLDAWYTNSSLTTLAGYPNGSYTPTSTRTLYAKWSVASVIPSWTDNAIALTATVNISYSDAVSATNTTAYSVTGVTETNSTGGTGTGYYQLFPGVFLNKSTGVISGTPTTAGSYARTIRATSSTGDFVSYSPTIVVTSQGKRMTGSSTYTAVQTAKRYDGSAWQNLSTAKRYNGSAWTNLS